MKRRTDFVTNSSSMSWIMAFFLGIPIGLASGLGHLAAHAGQNLSHGLNVAPGSQGAGSATPVVPPPSATAAPAGPGQPRGDLAWGGDAYILTGEDAHNWLRERGLMQGDKFTDKFWNEFYEPLPSDDRPPVEGLRAVGGDWGSDHNRPPGVISILVDDPSERKPAVVASATPTGGRPHPDVPPVPAGGEDKPGPAETAAPASDEEKEKPTDDEEGRKIEGPAPVVPVSPPPPPVPIKPPSVVPEDKKEPAQQPVAPAKEEGPVEAPKPPQPVEPTGRFAPGSNGDKIQQMLDDRLIDKDTKAVKPFPNVDARWELVVKGPGGGTFNVQIKEGRYTVSEGPAVAPNVVITMPQDIFDKATSKEGLGLVDGIDALSDMRVQDDGSGLQTLKDLGIDINILAETAVEAKLDADRKRFGPPHR